MFNICKYSGLGQNTSESFIQNFILIVKSTEGRGIISVGLNLS